MIEGKLYYSQNFLIVYIKQALEFMLGEFGLWSPVSPRWKVVRANQPTIQAMQDNTVYFDIISKQRIGVQGTRPIKDDDDGGWKLETIWFEEYLIQVSAFRKRDVEKDNASTVMSSDVISYLQACINANNDFGGFPIGGSKTYFGSIDGISVVRATDIREIDYETDSGLKDKLPQFDFKLIVRQRLLKKTPSIDKIDIETKRI